MNKNEMVHFLLAIGWVQPRGKNLYHTAPTAMGERRYRIRLLKKYMQMEYLSGGKWFYFGSCSYSNLHLTPKGCMVAGSLIFGDGYATGMGFKGKS